VNVVLDTNVLVSGVFFGGVPGRILEAWKNNALTLIVSPPILEEYRRVGALLAAEYEGVDLEPVLTLVAIHALVVEPATLPVRVCDDRDDEKFIACAAAGGARVVVSGDKGLRKASGWHGIEVLTPRTFVDRYMR